MDAALKTGEVSQRVEVSGDLLPQVETTSATIGGTLSSEVISQYSGEWPGLYEACVSESRGWRARQIRFLIRRDRSERFR